MSKKLEIGQELREHVKKTFHSIAGHIDKYMFGKPANSDIENGFFLYQKSPPEKFIYSGKWKLEKTLSNRHHNNTAIRVDYLTWKKNFYRFSFQNVPLIWYDFFFKCICYIVYNFPLAECPTKNASFFTYSLASLWSNDSYLQVWTCKPLTAYNFCYERGRNLFYFSVNQTIKLINEKCKKYLKSIQNHD